MPPLTEKIFSPEKIMRRLYVLHRTLYMDCVMGDISKEEMEKRFSYSLSSVGITYEEWKQAYIENC